MGAVAYVRVSSKAQNHKTQRAELERVAQRAAIASCAGKPRR
jgi:DNA invertase Pin-like site-specific DNA recombinase